MDPIALQRQLRNNSNDLLSFCEELKQWGAEMKRKDESLQSGNEDDTNIPLPRSKVIKTVAKSDKPELETKKEKPKHSKRIESSDYSAWEKFDVEAACAKLDEEKPEEYDSNELTDEYDEDAQSEAIYEKEKGNKYVKQQKWDEAIKCYTKAIECYGYDPIFYANRALCYLKKQRYQEAETDCTTALRLDKTYVKAYQRRAAAREALNQLSEAHGDLLKVFDYEPNNKESKAALMKLEKKLETFNKEVCTKKPEIQKPKSKFTISRQERKELKSLTNSASSSSTTANKTIIQEDKNKSGNQTDRNSDSKCSEEIKISTYWPSGNEVELVEKVYKPPHLRSKKPLKRVNIVDVDGINLDFSSEINHAKKDLKEECATAQPWPLPNVSSNVIKCDEFKVIERKIESDKHDIKEKVKTESKFSKERSNNKIISSTNKNINEVNEFNLTVPQTSVQFNSDWRLLKNNPESRFKYLKQVNPQKFATIFKESLDCDIFSGIIHTLAETFIKKNLPVYNYLLELCEVKRFSMLTMFMSDEDKKSLLKLADHMRLDDSLVKANIDNLMHKYGL
ncbi:hypothetical protein ILUMI_05617 [Ignelater luminosus]|uniref:RNA polymerase II-associated protein 3 n=1 Tax=Ignelater luminosus TaxID=2038154 RepID=A0A8K0D6T9_IGNLU|nr:hypothetical protein ILUMI_05617 [Ignelater luminosus]